VGNGFAQVSNPHTHFGGSSFVATYKKWWHHLILFLFFFSLFFDFCFLTMISSTFASAKTSSRYTLADTLRHSLGTTQVQCPQYKRTSPIGQGVQKEEGLTTDYNDGEESSPWRRRRLA